MKKNILLFLSLFLLINLSAQKNLNPGTFVYIDIENPSSVDKTNCPIVLNVDSLIKKFRNYNNQRIGIFLKNKELHTQWDDLDKDGKTDDVAFMVNLKAEEKIRLVARLLPPNFKQPNFEKGVYAFLGHREKKSDGTQIITPDTAISSDKDNMYNKVAQHGIAFESGPIAYRIYFNKKQTIDIYAKPTPRLELPITGWYPTADQLKKGFGDDVLLVGNSVGVGTFKGWNGKEATHVEKMSRRTQRIVTTGSLRNIIEIELRDWDNDGTTYDAKIRYIQYANHRDVKVSVQLSHKTSDNNLFCSGVMRMPENQQLFEKDGNLVASWGTDYPAKDTIKYKKETISFAVAVPEKYNAGRKSDQYNELILLKSDENNKIEYYFTAMSQKEKKALRTPEKFFAYTEKWRDEVLSTPIVTLSATFKK